MGINVRKRILMGEKTFKICKDCQLAYEEDSVFCRNCGKKLSLQKAKFYANIGKNGITSFSYKMANGITINSKGNASIPLGSGISYTISSKK